MDAAKLALCSSTVQW